MNLEALIEAVLFYKAEPMKKVALAELFDVTPDAMVVALDALSVALAGRGIHLVMTDETVQLATAPGASELIERVRKDDLSADIGKAGAETLAIILYRGPLTRAEIDSIRGVNSTFILRNLLIRGLIDRKVHPEDARSYVYAATPSLMNHLGIERREILPEFADIMNALDTFERHEAERTAESNPLM